jgi:hypothetical protein
MKGNEFSANFDTGQHKFDFGTMSRWRNIFTTEDDPDVELLELPFVSPPERDE